MKYIQITLSESDYAAIQAAAQADQRTVTAWARVTLIREARQEQETAKK